AARASSAQARRLQPCRLPHGQGRRLLVSRGEYVAGVDRGQLAAACGGGRRHFVSRALRAHLPRCDRTPPSKTAVSARAAIALDAALVSLTGCATLSQQDPLSVGVAGIEPLQGEGLELRLAIRVRIQNPNDAPIEYTGAALTLELNGRRLASGVSSA